METAHRGKTCGESGNCVMKLGLLLPYIRHIPEELQLWYGVSQWYRARGELNRENGGFDI